MLLGKAYDALPAAGALIVFQAISDDFGLIDMRAQEPWQGWCEFWLSIGDFGQLGMPSSDRLRGRQGPEGGRNPAS